MNTVDDGPVVLTNAALDGANFGQLDFLEAELEEIPAGLKLVAPIC
jgi:hypothetical protein